MDGLQAIAHVGQCPADDHGHGIGQERLANLVLDIHGRVAVVRRRNFTAVRLRGICRLVGHGLLSTHQSQEDVLDIEVRNTQRVVFDEAPTRFDDITHQRRKDIVGLYPVFDANLHQVAILCVHGGFRELVGVHLT